MPRQPVYPKGLDVRGKRLWKDVLGVRPRLGPGERVLLEEACRMSDRLEALNVIISGGAGPTYETEDGQVFTVVTDAAQQEARLTVVALRQVLMSLGLDRLQAPAAVPAPAPAADPAPAPAPAPADPLDQITAARERRQRGAS
jgi:hypothetical protein